MKIDAASVPTPSQMEPVAAKGHDDEESPDSSGFHAEITKLTTAAEAPREVNQRGNTKTKATALLRNDLPRMGTGEPAMSQLQPEASAGTCTIPVTVPVAIEGADAAARKLEKPIEWLMDDSGDFADAGTPEVAAKASEPATVVAAVVSGQNGGGTAKPDLPAVALSGAKVRLAQTKNELPVADLIVETTSPPPLGEIPLNMAAATSPGVTQSEVPGGTAPDGEPLAKPSPGSNAGAFGPTLATPQASMHISSTPGECIPPAASWEPAEGIAGPLAVRAHASAPEPERSTPEVTFPIADRSAKGFHTSESAEVTVSASPRTVVENPGPPDPAASLPQSAPSGTPDVAPRLPQSTGTGSVALRSGGSTADIIAPRLPQGTRAEVATSQRVGSSTAASRDTIPVSTASRTEPVLPTRDAASASGESDTWQAGSQPEPMDPATPKTGKEPVPAARAQRSGNVPPAASDAAPDRTGSAQAVVGKDPARNIVPSVMPQKQPSVKAPGPVQNLTPGSVQAGETSPGTPSRPVSAPTNRLPEFISQLADRLQLQIQRGENQIRIQLKPESLGLLQITAQNGVDGIFGRITTESVRVREFLENNLPVLQQNLQDQGLKVDRIEVVLQDSFDARQPNAQQQPLNHSGRGHSGDSSRRSSGVTRVQSRTSPDGFAVDPLSRLTLGPDSTFHTIA